jgi:hypothetical protein
MFSGALLEASGSAVDISTGVTAVGFTSANFVYANNKYTMADFATFHKFRYLAVYKRADTKWMTTFRGRGGVGSSAS